MSKAISFIDLSRYDRFTHALEYGHQGSARRMLTQSPQTIQVDDIPCINEWLAARLKHVWPESHVAEWPRVVSTQWHGWQKVLRRPIRTVCPVLFGCLDNDRVR